MSFEIHWEKFDKTVSLQLQSLLNQHFSTIQKPDYIGPMSITDFEFGTIPPSIEIQDITDPFPEFYEDTVEEEECMKSVISSSASSSNSNDNSVFSYYNNHNVNTNSTSFSNIHQNSSIPEASLHLGMNETLHRPLMGVYGTTKVLNGFYPSINHNGSGSYLHSPPYSPTPSISHHTRPYIPPSPLSSIPPPATAKHSPTDAQMQLLISYKGNMKMKVSTELLMNYPSQLFMSLPIRLNITGLSFHGTAIIAYVSNRINFCFLEPQDKECLLKDLHIESEVGDSEKHVLKNVGKIEKFISDQIRKIITEEFVFPNFHSFDLG